MTAPPGPAGPSDAELVARVLEADRDAFAVVYDRYGPRLFDFAYSMLRHREDAADAVADSFVLFAERLPQLREPDRLRPWLYAIVRSECLRRLKARTRVSYGDDEQLAAMPDDAITPEEAAERRVLTELVWDAAAGLADRDRALLDLHLRQGLEGAELGEAMGVTASNAYVMLNRLRGQVDRSLGALLIARLGREDCDELHGLLVDWDGSFSPLIRKRVARHVDGCEVCGERRKRMVSPWALLAAVPLFAVPAALRDRVLGETELVAYAGPPLQVSTPTTRTTSTRPGTRLAVAATAALLLGAGATIALWPDGDGTTPAASAETVAPTSAGTPSGTPTGAPPAREATAPATDPTASGEVSPTSSEDATPGAVAAPGSLTTTTTEIDLGASATRSSFAVSNAGDLPVSFTATAQDPWLHVTPGSARVAGGAGTLVSVRADRAHLAEGRVRGAVVLRWPGGRITVHVALTEDRAPVVGAPTASAAPTCSTPTVTVRAAVSDGTGLPSVRLLWSGPNGAHSATMARSGSGWTAPMGPFTLGGTVTFRVVATDSAGHTTTGPSRTVEATPCPG